jgi:outer membrane murein-binding lipoprotein Lpp
MADRRRLLVAAALAATALLAGCSDDDSGPLTDDQLPSKVVESETDTAGTPSATLCPPLTQVQQDIALNRTTHADSYRYWTYRLDDGSGVTVAVIDPGTQLEDWDRTTTDFQTAVEECSTREDVGEIAQLDDLPDGAVGYSSSTTDSNGTKVGETVLAQAGDRVVLVAATHDEGAKASVDVRDVLSDVQESAPDLDLS